MIFVISHQKIGEFRVFEQFAHPSFLRTEEIAQGLKTTLKESDLADEDFVKAQINAVGNELQELIDDFIDESGHLRSKIDVVVILMGTVVGTVSAPVAKAGFIVGNIAAKLFFDWW